MIKATVFDFGGVLFPLQPWIGTKPEKKKFSQIKQVAIDAYEKNQRLIDENRYTTEDFKKDLYDLNTYGLNNDEISQIYRALTTIDEEILSLAKKLGRSHKVFGLVNEVPKWTELRRYFFNLDGVFEKIFVSAYIGHKKPDEAIFKHFLKETRLNAQECVFIDDREENATTAKGLGFHAIRFEGDDELKESLKALSVDCL